MQVLYASILPNDHLQYHRSLNVRLPGGLRILRRYLAYQQTLRDSRGNFLWSGGRRRWRGSSGRWGAGGGLEGSGRGGLWRHCRGWPVGGGGHSNRNVLDDILRAVRGHYRGRCFFLLGGSGVALGRRRRTYRCIIVALFGGCDTRQHLGKRVLVLRLALIFRLGSGVLVLRLGRFCSLRLRAGRLRGRRGLLLTLGLRSGSLRRRNPSISGHSRLSRSVGLGSTWRLVRNLFGGLDRTNTGMVPAQPPNRGSQHNNQQQGNTHQDGRSGQQLPPVSAPKLLSLRVDTVSHYRSAAGFARSLHGRGRLNGWGGKLNWLTDRFHYRGRQRVLLFGYWFSLFIRWRGRPRALAPKLVEQLCESCLFLPRFGG